MAYWHHKRNNAKHKYIRDKRFAKKERTEDSAASHIK